MLISMAILYLVYVQYSDGFVGVESEEEQTCSCVWIINTIGDPQLPPICRGCFPPTSFRVTPFVWGFIEKYENWATPSWEKGLELPQLKVYEQSERPINNCHLLSIRVSFIELKSIIHHINESNYNCTLTSKMQTRSHEYTTRYDIHRYETMVGKQTVVIHHIIMHLSVWYTC